MANLITQYDNGTFEGLPGAWAASYGVASSAQNQDNIEFFEGANSVRLTTVLISNAGFSNGHATFLIGQFPGVTGESYEVSIRVKCNGDVPDDAVFFIEPFQPDLSHGEDNGFMTPARASLVKTGWIELKANFHANAIGGQVYFYVSVMFDNAQFNDALSFSDEATRDFYSNVIGFSASTPIPAGAFVWLDFAQADVKAIPEAPNLQFMGRRLYYVKNVFYLQAAGQPRQVIDEPIKWDDITIQTIFDKKTKAYRFEFSDKDIILEFDNAAGQEILRDEYKRQGTNGDVRLMFGEYDTIANTLLFHYIGQLVFEACEETQFFFKGSIERQSLSEKLRTYFDTKVNLYRDKSLGGFARPALELQELYLHPRLLTYKANYAYNNTVDVNAATNAETPGGLAKYETAVPPFTYTIRPPGGTVRTSNNIKDLDEPIPGTDGKLIYSGLNLPPGIKARSFYFDCQLQFTFTMGNASSAVLGGFTIFKRSNIATGPNDGQNPPFVDPPADDTYLISSDNYGNVAGNKAFNGSVAGQITIKADEAIFIKAWLYASDGTLFNITNFKWVNVSAFFLNVNEQSVYFPSVIKASRLHEVLNRQLELILDVANPLKSTLVGRTDLGYAANGCASDHFLMDGKAVRDLPDKPLSISVKDWYGILDGVYNCGMSVERDINENESVRFQEMPYFFRDVMLINLTVIANYVKRPASDYLFNEINASFTKYQRNNQQDSLEDFHTEMNYITPLNKIKNKLEIKIDGILSGNYIEETRRQSFNVNPTNAYETDNDLFLISAKPADTPAGVNITFDAATDTIVIFSLVPVMPFDDFTIANATGAIVNGVYRPLSVEIPFSYDRVIITTAPGLVPSTGPGTGDFALVTNGRYRAKRDDDFTVVTGITSPQSVYNLEHHLKLIVLRWAKMFQAGWTFYLGDNSKGIEFTEGKNNTEARTKLNPLVACKFGDSLNLDRKDSGFERVTQMDKPIFDKDEIEFDAPLTWSTFNYLRYAFEGRNPDGKDYGYVQIKNPRGIVERGFITSMKFKPNQQMCKFTLIQKYDA
jgi:hypothetical protein